MTEPSLHSRAHPDIRPRTRARCPRDGWSSRSMMARPATRPRLSGWTSPSGSAACCSEPLPTKRSRRLRPARCTRLCRIAQLQGTLRNGIEHRLHVASASSEITRRISLIAVCCSSASFVSLNSRTLSIAIAAWRANVCTSATWSGRTGRGSRRNRQMHAVCAAFAHQRHREHRADAQSRLVLARVRVLACRAVAAMSAMMHRLAVERRAAGDADSLRAGNAE